MFVLLVGLLGCAPADSAVETAPVATGIRVELTIPGDLSTAAALDLALLEATLADMDTVVVDVAGGQGPAAVDVQTPIGSVWRGTVTGAVDHVVLELCDPRRCRTHRGPGRGATLARRFGQAPATPWSVPDADAANRAGRAARVLYGYSSVRERDLGTPRDPVVVALEAPSSALAYWIHGRREARAGRVASAAWSFEAVAKRRATPRARLQSAWAWHLAGWTDAAFELTRDVETDDVRAFTPLARIAGAHASSAHVERWLARLPDRPATDALAYAVQPSTSHLARWAATSPDDAALRQAQIRRALERQDVEGLLVDVPALAAHRMALRAAAALAAALDRAERAAEDVARAQNAFTSVRRRGRVPCDSPVRDHVPAARAGLVALRELQTTIDAQWGTLADAPVVLQPTAVWLGDRVTAVQRARADLAAVQKSVLEARRCPGG